MSELWYLSFDGLNYAAPTKTDAEIAALKTGGEVKVWNGTISAHINDVKQWDERIDFLIKHNSKVIRYRSELLEKKLSLAKSILYAIAKTYDDNELRSKALDAYNDL